MAFNDTAALGTEFLAYLRGQCRGGLDNESRRLLRLAYMGVREKLPDARDILAKMDDKDVRALRRRADKKIRTTCTAIEDLIIHLGVACAWAKPKRGAPPKHLESFARDKLTNAYYTALGRPFRKDDPYRDRFLRTAARMLGITM